MSTDEITMREGLKMEPPREQSSNSAGKDNEKSSSEYIGTNRVNRLLDCDPNLVHSWISRKNNEKLSKKTSKDNEESSPEFISTDRVNRLLDCDPKFVHSWMSGTNSEKWSLKYIKRKMMNRLFAYSPNLAQS